MSSDRLRASGRRRTVAYTTRHSGRLALRRHNDALPLHHPVPGNRPAGTMAGIYAGWHAAAAPPSRMFIAIRARSINPGEARRMTAFSPATTHSHHQATAILKSSSVLLIRDAARATRRNGSARSAGREGDTAQFGTGSVHPRLGVPDTARAGCRSERGSFRWPMDSASRQPLSAKANLR
jgi:hypothetical protein